MHSKPVIYLTLVVPAPGMQKGPCTGTGPSVRTARLPRAAAPGDQPPGPPLPNEPLLPPFQRGRSCDALVRSLMLP